MFDSLHAFQDDEDLNPPEQKERNPRVDGNIQDGCVAEQMRPAWRHNTEQSIDCCATDPRLNSKPATGNDRAEDRGNVCALRSEGSAAKNREGHSILSAGVRVENHRYEHDRVAQQDRDHCLPPVHPRFDKTAGERVGGYDHAHANPERGDVPGRPGALFDCRRSEILVPERTAGNVFRQFDEVALGGSDSGGVVSWHAMDPLVNLLQFETNNDSRGDGNLAESNRAFFIRIRSANERDTVPCVAGQTTIVWAFLSDRIRFTNCLTNLPG